MPIMSKVGAVAKRPDFRHDSGKTPFQQFYFLLKRLSNFPFLKSGHFATAQTLKKKIL
jgi:hypothetical protein